jgi:hypothetical protein
MTNLINPYRFGGADPMLTDMVGWWSLDETSGMRYDSHGSLNLTDRNTVLYDTGKQGNAASFVYTNSEDLVNTDAAALQLSTFDLFFWWKSPAIFASNDGVISMGAIGGLDNWWVGTASGTQIIFDGKNAAGININDLSFSPVAPSTWYFIRAQSRAASNIIVMYVDTVGQGSSVCTGGLSTAGNDFCIGSRRGSGYGTQLVDEVVIFNALQSSEIAGRLWNSGNGMAYPG